jgi:hypothetical protein
VIPIAVLHLWPIIPAMALMWRWSRARFFGALLLWCVATWVALFVIGLWRQIDMGPLLVRQIMASEIGLTVAILSLVFFLGDATRAIAPWLLVPTAVLVSSLLAGLDALTYMAERESPLLKALIIPLEGLPGWSGVVVVFGLFLLLAGIIAWWPVRVLGRALGRAYSRKWLSDLLVVFTGVWAFALTDKALAAVDSNGDGACWSVASASWSPTHPADPAGLSAGCADTVFVRPHRRALAPKRQHRDDRRNRPRRSHSRRGRYLPVPG